MIHVTKTFLPPLDEYQKYIERIWESRWLTNQGPLLQDFEAKAARYLGVTNFHFVTNGTVALQLALRTLELEEGEIITTPFSYVATVSSILWEHCQPVFVDIEPDTLCLDAAKIEAAITPRTRAILPVHVFGNPCDVEAIAAVAAKHNLKVIYDAAHAFGVQYQGKSLLDYGDLAICSFHATKLFHTIEGGCVIAKDTGLSDKVELMKRFGHTGDEHFQLGINAKASEFQAAMGLCNLSHIDESITKRRAVVGWYDQLLGSRFQRPKLRENTHYNYAYYPVMLESEAQLVVKLEAFKQAEILPRRYFYPSLNTLPYLTDTQSCPVSEDVAKRIICLPLYDSLEESNVHKICEVLLA